MTREPIASPATHVVIWQTRALADLNDIHDFIAQDAPGPALRTATPCRPQPKRWSSSRSRGAAAVAPT